MSRRLVAVGLVLAATVAGGCESTSERAAERRAAQAGEARRLAEAVQLEVVPAVGIDAEVLAVINAPDEGLAAVVVGMTNTDPRRSVVWAPIDVQLRDAAGAVVVENTIAGADPTLVHVPSLPAQGQAFYVNDQFPVDREVVDADVVLGGELRPLATLPEPLPTSGVELVVDPDYGASFVGDVTNSTSVVQQQLIVQAIVRRGGAIVAAGTAVLRAVAPGATASFNGFFVGDPTGGTLEVFVPPSNWPGAEGAPASQDPADVDSVEDVTGPPPTPSGTDEGPATLPEGDVPVPLSEANLDP